MSFFPLIISGRKKFSALMLQCIAFIHMTGCVVVVDVHLVCCEFLFWNCRIIVLRNDALK